MSKLRHRNKIRKDDYSRVLVTETLPFETPIIFSNDGLYERIKNIDLADPLQRRLIEALIFGRGEGKVAYTVPYLYKIRKNSCEYRRLALVHPRSQWKIKEFYERYEDLVTYYCGRSPASIRAPTRVASSFFVKSELENLNQYKSGSAALTSSDQFVKHAPSFFAYEGVDRLYKFFESADYFELEKQYSIMLTLDVSKCFDSIYSHTISWAVKDKDFIKRTLPVLGTFGSDFDAVMMHANHSETNGIVIGPEVSRVFAEIIFQTIDVRSIGRIKISHGLEFGREYTFRRYVDDVFIFAESEEIAELVYATYTDVLLEFNLHSNSSKRRVIARPFITEKSRLIMAASRAVNDFVNKFLIDAAGNTSLKPLPIRSTFRLVKSFVDSIKSICSHGDVNYDEVSAYLVAVLTERVKKLVAVSDDMVDASEARIYQDAILVLLETLFFLYQVSPSVGASYKFCTSIILVVRFSKKRIRQHYPTIAQRIYELTESLFVGQKLKGNNSVKNLLPLEVLNVVLAARELGGGFLLSANTVKSLFLSAPQRSYFDIISCLFYIRDDGLYGAVRDQLVADAKGLLGSLSDLRTDSEKAYLLLDLLSCPFIDEQIRKSWLKDACAALSIGTPTNAEVHNCLADSEATPSHVNWREVDLLTTLEKKELKRAY